MLAAELKGKLPSALQNYEDILTSSVIGIFQYLSSPIYIGSMLESSVNINGDFLKFDSPMKECWYYFWPRLDTSEPDVLLHLQTEKGSKYVVCIEAKYWSDKSSTEDERIEIEERTSAQRDQLAREIEDLHKQSSLYSLNIDCSKLNKVRMIYLTNHTSFPFADVRDSIANLQGISSFLIEDFYWLTWREIHHTISKISNFNTMQDEKLLKDLKSLLERKGLNSFNGFYHQLKRTSRINHTYSNGLTEYSWSDTKISERVTWMYEGE